MDPHISLVPLLALAGLSTDRSHDPGERVPLSLTSEMDALITTSLRLLPFLID